MNKSELTRELATQCNLSDAEAAQYVDIFFYEMHKTMLTGGRIEIRGFGSFKMKDYEAYTGRNPKTGESVHVAPKRLPFFKVGRELHELLNQ
jgi:integration host factor subunit beta